MEKYTMFMDWKNQYGENEYTLPKQFKDLLQSLSSYNGIFHRTRTNNFTVCMEIPKTLNSQSNLEKEEWN